VTVSAIARLIDMLSLVTCHGFLLQALKASAEEAEAESLRRAAAAAAAAPMDLTAVEPPSIGVLRVYGNPERTNRSTPLAWPTHLLDLCQ